MLKMSAFDLDKQKSFVPKERYGACNRDFKMQNFLNK